MRVQVVLGPLLQTHPIDLAGRIDRERAAWSPIFALIIAVPLFLIFLAYVGFSRRADQAQPQSSGEPVSGEGEGSGMWGEKRF